VVQFQIYREFLIFKKKIFLIKSCILNNFYSYLFGDFFVYQFFLEWFQFFCKDTRDNFGTFRSELFHLSPYYFGFTVFMIYKRVNLETKYIKNIPFFAFKKILFISWHSNPLQVQKMFPKRIQNHNCHISNQADNHDHGHNLLDLRHMDFWGDNNHQTILDVL